MNDLNGVVEQLFDKEIEDAINRSAARGVDTSAAAGIRSFVGAMEKRAAAEAARRGGGGGGTAFRPAGRGGRTGRGGGASATSGPNGPRVQTTGDAIVPHLSASTTRTRGRPVFGVGRVGEKAITLMGDKGLRDSVGGTQDGGIPYPLLDCLERQMQHQRPSSTGPMGPSWKLSKCPVEQSREEILHKGRQFYNIPRPEEPDAQVELLGRSPIASQGEQVVTSDTYFGTRPNGSKGPSVYEILGDVIPPEFWPEYLDDPNLWAGEFPDSDDMDADDFIDYNGELGDWEDSASESSSSEGEADIGHRPAKRVRFELP